MRLESHAPLGDFAELRQAHHLITAGISKYRPAPVHEFMQAAKFGDSFCAGAERT